MEFTQEQREYIDWKLRQSDERQLKNGNKTYTIEELKKEFAKPLKGENYYRIQTYCQ